MGIAEQFQSALNASGQTYDRQMARMGLTLATVTNITDPDKLNRVKCLPIENKDNEEETDWCYVMAPLGGANRGQFFFPSVDDQVVLAYLGGDPHRPMVIGGWWNTQVSPPYAIEDGKVYNYSVKTPTGTELLLYDEPDKQKATLTLPSGSVLRIDDENKAIALQDKAGDNVLTMDLDGGNVELKAKTKLTLAAGDTTITLEASGSITVKASQKVSIEAATIEEKGSTKVSVEGGAAEVKSNGTLTLQATGPAALKGAVVNIN